MRILHLTLKKKWFDMVSDPNPDARKKEEYRELKAYWTKRFLSQKTILNPFTHVLFRHGYAADAPEICFVIEGISVGVAKPEWSDNWKGEVFVIKLGREISSDECAFMAA